MDPRFQHIQFNGTFRDYQQRIIDNFESHINDKKVHIVAAPGSGKTILGLELIRKIGGAALILSPTITIREQWEERFRSLFCPDEATCTSLYSHDIRHPKLLTSITYQALHAAYKRELDIEKIEADDESEEAEVIDFKDFQLKKIIQENRITTICLDEAHHLKLEWHKALTELIRDLGEEIFIVALTATPPYDSKEIEWKRYTELCGEIDDEIFVPQLVAQKTLCPHQDYIHFSYPTREERIAWLEYKQNIFQTVEEIIKSAPYQTLLQQPIFTQLKEHERFNIIHLKPLLAILSTLSHSGATIHPSIKEAFDFDKKFYPYKVDDAKLAFNFILENPDVFGIEICTYIEEELKKKKMVRGKKVQMDRSEKLRRKMSGSLGKLTSIQEIVHSEYSNLSNQLRMLILTDYIRGELTPIIGSDEPIDQISTVTIFESLRRTLPNSIRLALLSGSLIIVHSEVMSYATQFANNQGIKISSKPLNETGYVVLQFAGKSKQKVALITELFSNGLIEIIIGTKSLLGEGWDAPCINSLILASFVGSYVLSNQMRGRAIRTDIRQPNKTANVWHLVTIEPSEESKLASDSGELQSHNNIYSEDFEQCRRKFENFMGPSYCGTAIESGIGRCNIITPPFYEDGFARINKEMLALAANREGMRNQWINNVPINANFSVMQVEQVSAERVEKAKKIVKKVTYYNVAILAFIAAVIGFLTQILHIFHATLSNYISYTYSQTTLFGVSFFILVIIIAILQFSIFDIVKKLSPHRRLEKILSALLDTLRKKGDISSINAKVEVLTCTDSIALECGLQYATRKEMRIFSEASNQILECIESPRYVMIYQLRRCGFRKNLYLESYSVPAAISNKKSLITHFEMSLQQMNLPYVIVDTRSYDGLRLLKKCRKHSIVNKNHTRITGKMIAVH